MAVSFGNLDDTVLSNVLAFCSPQDCERFGTLNKTFLKASRADNLWHKWTQEVFKTQACQGPSGTACATWREAFITWMCLFQGRDIERCLVAVRFWAEFKAWAADALPPILETLARGVSPEELAEEEGRFGFRLPDELAALYLLHDGQTFQPRMGQRASGLIDPRATLGLFGSYVVYHHFVSTDLLPLKAAVRLSRIQTAQQRLWTQPEILTFAASVKNVGVNKALGVNCATGEVVGLGADHFQVPLVQSPAGQEAPNTHTQLAIWLSTYVERLQGGVYSVRKLSDLDSTGLLTSLGHQAPQGEECSCIHLFPESGPLVSEAVTNGVRVRASVVLEVESSREHSYTFSYCIRYSHVLPKGAAVPMNMVPTCQLLSRHWRCYDAQGVLGTEVRGPGVVGLHPEIYPGCKEVTYQSKTEVVELGQYMDGTFSFVPGQITAQTGPSFDVVCPRLKFEHPGCIY